LINCSRGQLVDEVALYHALKQEQIAAAGVDVLSQEPPDKDNLLLKAQNCYITPHIAWATIEARKRLLDTVVENIEAFLRQQPQNVVNEV
jgi:glycerate dehydrogenase